jgi:ABC-type multidrug transport system fused ATPase/permease subunit
MNSLWAHMQAFFASSRDLKALVGEARQHREPESAGRPAESLRDAVVFSGVSFRYPTAPEGSLQLQDLSFTLERDRMTALVGRSGAGKTTLAHLLTGLHTPTGGEILVDGTPLGELNGRSWRRRIGLVPQEPFLFNRTIRWNLEFGSEGRLDGESTRKLLEATHCGFVERLPGGIDTEVGERGVRLSQGQRQRLAIAHAVACGNELLVLDEPTSALDAESEAALQATFERWHGKMTMLVIAHRLSTIRHADQILVLDEGRIAGRGSHGDLMESSPLYRSLFETQLLAS